MAQTLAASTPRTVAVASLPAPRPAADRLSEALASQGQTQGAQPATIRTSELARCSGPVLGSGGAIAKGVGAVADGLPLIGGALGRGALTGAALGGRGVSGGWLPSALGRRDKVESPQLRPWVQAQPWLMLGPKRKT